MKRSIIVTVSIGVLVAGILCALQAYGVLFRTEFAVTDLVMRHSNIGRLVGNHWQYFLITLFAFSVAWMTIEGARRGWAWWVMAILLLELIAVTLVCALYQVFFQPLPSIIAATASFVLAYCYHLLARGGRARVTTEMFSAHVSPQQLERVIASKYPVESRATSHEATVVVCDIANKHELAEDAPPEALASMLDGFVRFATDLFLREGAYIQSADGEGVVSIFGFPVDDENHAELASGAALQFQTAFGELRKSKDRHIWKMRTASRFEFRNNRCRAFAERSSKRNCADGRTARVGATFLHRQSHLWFADSPRPAHV